MNYPKNDMNHCTDMGCNDTHINVEEDLCHVSVDGMESAYQYELWNVFGIVTKIKRLIEKFFRFLETITEEEVKDMWKD